MAAGHQHHFLSRLDRLSLPHAELALSLYNDAELVRVLLHEALVPDETPRIALSLGEGDHGPHLVVARDGHFITALAEGMSVTDIPIVDRATFDLIARRVDVLRQRMESSRKTSARTGNIGSVFAHFRKAAHLYSREDFRAVVAFHPFLRGAILQAYAGHIETLIDMRRDFPALRLLKGSPRQEVNDMVWSNYWSMLHLMVFLGADDGWNLAGELQREGHEDQLEMLLWVPARVGHFSALARSAWMASRILRQSTDRLIERYNAAPTEVQTLALAVALVGIAEHDASRRTTILEGLAQPSPSPELVPMRQLWHHVASQPTEAVEALARAMTFLLFERKKALSGVALPYPDEASVPLAAQQLKLSMLWGDLLTMPESIVPLLPTMRVLARAEPESFFPPAAERSVYCVERPDDPLTAIFQREDSVVRAPVKAAAAPGRNDPCPCGSGKKYKQCHLGKKLA